MDITIREATTNDTSELEELFLIIRQTTFHWELKDKFKKEDYTNSVEGEKVFVAEANGKIIGFISIWVQDNFIHNLFVHPEWQKQGVGTQLLKKAAELDLNRNMQLKVVTANSYACSFYKKQGWKVKAAGESSDGPYNLLEIDPKTISTMPFKSN